MSYTYSYPRPAVTVDTILFNQDKKVLLIRRKRAPFQGLWALPGGFVNENEALETAARRELQEETCLTAGELSQLVTVGEPGRDPRGHTISIVFTGAARESYNLLASDDAAEAKWFSLDNLPELAFDHQKIFEYFQKVNPKGGER